MKKQEKVDYINSVYWRFENARNHGNGGSWWYPKPFVIAYNVKMSSFVVWEKVREQMSERQNSYYSDDMIMNIEHTYLNLECEQLIDDVKYAFDIDCWFAGRMGGWFEVQFTADLEEVDGDMPIEDINMYYKKAKELEKTEQEVHDLVKKAHKALNEYIDTPQFYKEFVEDNMNDDEDIAEIYKGRIQNLVNELK